MTQQQYICVDGPDKGKMGTISAPEERFMFRDEDNTGFYRPKRPTTYVDTNLSGRALEVYWHEDPRR